MANHRLSRNHQTDQVRVLHPDSPAGRHFDWASIGVPHPDSPAGRHFDWASINIPHPRSPAGRLSIDWGATASRILEARHARGEVCVPHRSTGTLERNGLSGIEQRPEVTVLAVQRSEAVQSFSASSGGLTPATDSQNLPSSYMRPSDCPQQSHEPTIGRDWNSPGYYRSYSDGQPEEQPDVPESEKYDPKEKSDQMGEEAVETPAL